MLNLFSSIFCPDREGEAIAWHLAYLLGIDQNSICRVTFNDQLCLNPLCKLVNRHQKVGLLILGQEDFAIPDPEAQLVAALHAIPDWAVPYLAYMT